MAPALTVVTICRNVRAALRDTAASVLDQEWTGATSST
jgi:hypothetical protein